MAQELSSNWKKLQAKIKAESTTAASKPATKRKPDEASESQSKRQTKRPKLQRQTPRQDTAFSKADSRGSKSRPKPMGIAQSSAVSRGSSSTIAPSLALWADDNDISAESLAEAYGLGVRNNVLLNGEKPRINEGLAPNLNLGKYVAIDCEMVGIGPDGYDSALARVSLVDFHGRQVYDSYVRPKERVTDWRTKITGITPKHMASARDFDTVQKEVADLLKGRIVVGHDIRHDLAALILTHPVTYIRDTARFSGFKQYGNGPKPALRTLAKELLDLEIQMGHHSSIEDAKVAMLLFRKKKSEFDMEHANKYEKPPGTSTKAKRKPQHSKKHKH
ncbi:RNA exonuclease 4 [Pseudomassariella vexata]|uniref:RNA exonuclease 4 n=1 Tax=Pseudomassariella vexata TaxID=1141098 RepID=A0A1Y2DKH8_9PEZI|nr:RNA exonuclease 4 [Pseudomassariella vexata]ORY59711.1 RNA exonuclease 4 [Pseudomassariella vexata]